MFESAEVGHAVDKKTFHKEEESLRAQLLDAQTELRKQARFPVILLISGVDGAGKGETIAKLYEWMDPRYLSTVAFTEPTDEERERPFMWRYWRALPPRGRLGGVAGPLTHEGGFREVTAAVAPPDPDDPSVVRVDFTGVLR